MSIPARSTATQLYTHWLGGLDRDWGGTLLADPRNPIRVGEFESTLRGSIINELPGALKNVTIIWVKNQRLTVPRYVMSEGVEQPYSGLSGRPLNVTEMWRRPATPEWSSGAKLDLSQLFSAEARDGHESLMNGIRGRYIAPYSKSGFTGTAGVTSVDDRDRRNYFEMLSIFNQLNPPEYLKAPNENSVEQGVAFHRQLGRELDLSPWFNRPCLIIIGLLENSPCPAPLRIDDEGNLPVTKSVTVVRWVYPLPLNEAVAFREVFEGAN